MGLNETDLMDDISTLTLRVAFWDHLHYAAISNDPDSMLENARTKLNSFSFDGNDRLTLVRDVLLRILDSQQRKYREIVDRDVSLSSPNRNDDSEITSDDNTDTLLDMSDTDLSEIDLSELNLTEEELAILQE